MDTQKSYRAWHRFYRLSLQNIFEKPPPAADWCVKASAMCSISSRLTNDSLDAARRRHDYLKCELDSARAEREEQRLLHEALRELCRQNPQQKIMAAQRIEAVESRCAGG